MNQHFIAWDLADDDEDWSTAVFFTKSSDDRIIVEHVEQAPPGQPVEDFIRSIYAKRVN